MSEQQNKDKKPSTVTCPNCGAEVSNRRIYCPECGTNVKSGTPRTVASKPKASSDKVKATATDDRPTPEVEPAAPSAEQTNAQAAEPTPTDTVGAAEQSDAKNPADGAEQSDAKKIVDEVQKPQPRAEALNDYDDYFSYTPSGEPLHFGTDQSNGGGHAAQNGKCSKCGADVPLGAKFCGACGAVQERRCIRCGEPLADDARFCKACGAPQDVAVLAAQSAPAKPSAEDKRRRALNTASTLWLTIGMVLGVVFMLTDFLTVYIYRGGESFSFGQDGFALFGVLFGGRSSLTTVGVPIELLRFAGWLYLAAILTIIMCVVCIVLNGMRNKKTAPFGTLAVSAVYLAVGIGVLVVVLIARSMVDVSAFDDNIGVTCYMGGIGVFVGAVISFVGTLVVFLISRKAYTEKPDKKGKRLGVGYYCGLGAVVVAIGALACVPAFVGYSEKSVAPGGSGHSTVRITEGLDDTVYGGDVIKLDALERGHEYSFTIRTDDVIDAEFMEDCLILCYYDEVQGKSMIEIALSADYIEFNQTKGKSTATIKFEYDTDRELAIVVTFAASSNTSVGYRYEFSEIL